MSEKSSIVFVNQSSGYLMIDIVNAFGEQCKERILITGLLNPRNTPLDQEVKVKKIIAFNRSSTLRRLFTWVCGFLQALFWIKWKYRKAHLFLVSNPPFAPLIPLLCSNSYILLIYDVYPDALVEYKVLSHKSLFIRWWEKANRRIYTQAEQVFTLSEGMKEQISKYLPKHRIKVVPIWTDNRFFQPIIKTNNLFLNEQDLNGKFLVLYSGNLGRSHDLKALIKLAKKMIFDPEIFFMIIGGGDQYEILKHSIEMSGLVNMRILPWQPTAMLPSTLAAADIGIVSLGKEASRLSLPSKTFNLMSVGVPILAIASEDSALSIMVSELGIGESFGAEQITEMEQFILNVKNDTDYRASLRERSLQSSNLFTPKNAELFLEHNVQGFI